MRGAISSAESRDSQSCVHPEVVPNALRVRLQRRHETFALRVTKNSKLGGNQSVRTFGGTLGRVAIP